MGTSREAIRGRWGGGIAVEEHGLSLQCVPEQMKTVDMCTAAVTAHGSALEFVPEQMKPAVAAAINKQ